jgi:hypothetical protein
MIYPENDQLWKLFLDKGDTALGFIWHGDFNSGVAKELTHC